MAQKQEDGAILGGGQVETFEKRAKRGRPRGKGTQVVYDALRKEILTLVAKPGDHLDEAQAFVNTLAKNKLSGFTFTSPAGQEVTALGK